MMSTTHFAPSAPLPLPPGWTEHGGPAGQLYYYNAETKESTYVRPWPSFQNLPPPPQRPKKEKPLIKTPIQGTEWIRVKTTEGNIFYSNKEKKESSWTIPEEIAEAVAVLEIEEKRQRQQQEMEEEARKARIMEDERALEIERIKLEVQEMVKRKAEDVVPFDEAVVSKKARVEDASDEDGGDLSEEEDWQREAAAQLAAEAEKEKKRFEEDQKQLRDKAEAEARKLQIPDRVDLSIDEAKALFKTLLRERNINPLHPWDMSLPLFISDPRYVLLPSISARREAFDEYCRDRARELRQSNVKEAANPKDSFENLLKENVKSTRTSWNDFRRTWKKDRRFYGWGRDDREREKRFREFMKELGEKKRAAAQKAEADFFSLLRECQLVRADSVWKEVKQKICDDSRYDRVGSSSLREELFNAFLKADNLSSPIPIPALDKSSTVATADATQRRSEDEELGEQEHRWEDRKKKAVKEREDKVRAARNRVEADIGRSRMGLYKEEGELEFRNMLINAVRDPQVSWEDVHPQLRKDPRFIRSALPTNQQHHLFHAHISQLRSRHLNSLYSLFDADAPSLATAFSSLPLVSLLSSQPVTKLGFDVDTLREEFEKWQRERTTMARKDFDEMLSENSFVNFWVRLGKIGGEGVDGGVQAEDIGEDEGEGGGGKVDMKVLAKNVDSDEIEKVLRNDRRYIMFEHVPQQRERWIRDYLSKLSAPKLSVHLPGQG